MADPTPDPQWAALRRAVHAALDAHDRTRAPFLVYLESAYGARVIAESSRERALYTASSHEHEPGDIYAAVFDVRDSAWPDPVWSQYLPAPADRVAVAGVGLWPEIIGAPTPTGPVTSPEQVDTTQIVIDPQPGSPVPTPGAPELSQRDLYAAADQLFWNATGYKPNTPLNPKDPRDRAMLPQWWQAYAQARALAYASGFPVPGAPPGQRPQVDWSQQSFGPGTPGAPEITVGPVTVTPSNPVSSGVVGMNSGDPWLPLLRNAPLSVGANAAEYGLRSSVRARSALVGALAPVLAPGTGAITGRIDLDANQVLHAKICVDGRCYQGSVDLSGPLDMVLQRLEAWHQAQHARGIDGPGTPSSAPVVGHGGGGGGGHGGGGYHGGYGGGHGYGGIARRYYPSSWRRWGGGYSYYAAPWWYQPDQVIVEEVEVAPPDADPNAEPGPAPQQDDPNATSDASSQQTAVQGLIRCAGDALVRDLVHTHVQVACAGWFDDFKHAVSSAAGGLAHAALGTLKKLKGPISMAAQYAAASVPGLGPIVGPMAGKLAGNLIDAAAGNTSAQAAVQQATQQAASNPTLLRALATAHQMAAKTVAAYHLAQTATNAAQGDPNAIAQVQQTVQSAQAGDPAAQQAAAVMNASVAQSCQAAAAPAPDPNAQPDPWAGTADPNAQPDPNAAQPAVQGWPPGFVQIVGTTVAAAIGELRARASQAVLAARAGGAGPVLGYVITAQGATLAPLADVDAADDWFGRLSPDSFLYAAYYDATDPTWPAPLNEATGNVVAARPPGTPIQRAPATVQGWPIPLALGVAAGAGALYGWEHRDALRKWLTGQAA